MNEVFVGFNSAWPERNKGAISYAVFQSGVLEKAKKPQPSSFPNAAEIINKLQEECHDVLVAVDQPIIVPNHCGSRSFDRVAASLMSQLHSGVQPPHRTRERGWPWRRRSA